MGVLPTVLAPEAIVCAYRASPVLDVFNEFCEECELRALNGRDG